MYLFGKKSDTGFAIGVFLWGLFLSFLYAISYKPHFDIHQMLERAYLLVAKGQLVCYGNAASAGMGKVPGCLSSLLVGGPMFLWNSPYAALVFLVLLHIVSLYLLLKVLSHYFDRKILLIFFFIFWLSPWRLSEIYLWNPSYLFLAMALHFLSAFHLREKAHFGYMALHIFSIAFAFQIHNSSIILLFISAFLFWKKALKVHWLGAFFALFASAASLIPYLYALMNDPQISPQIREDKYFFFRGLVYVFPMLKAVWYWIRFSGAVFPKRIFQLLEFSWLRGEELQTVVRMIWILLQYSVALVSVVFSWKANRFFVRKYKPLFNVKSYRFTAQENWLAAYTVATFLAILLAAAISPIDLIFWHLIIIYPIAHIPLLIFIKEKGEGWPIKKVIVSVFIYFSIYNIFCVLGSDKFSMNENPQRDYVERYGLEN